MPKRKYVYIVYCYNDKDKSIDNVNLSCWNTEEQAKKEIERLENLELSLWQYDYEPIRLQGD